MRETVLCNVNLFWADLKQSDMTGAVLRWSRLNRASFLGTDLTSADCSQTTAIEVDLRSANLTDSNWQGANLNGADVSRAVMKRRGFHRCKNPGFDVDYDRSAWR